MVYLFGGCHPAFGIAPLTIGMGLEVFVPYPFPLTAIFLFHIRGPLVLVVLLPGPCAVLLAVGLVGQLRAAGVSTGALRFPWHGSLFLSAMEDLPQLEADDVPHLFAVRNFPVGHGGSFFRVGIAKAPADCSVEARSAFLSIVILSQEATIFLYILLSYIARLSNPLRARSCSLYV